MKKLIFVLIVIAAVMVVAMPVAAEDPNPYLPGSLWFNRTPEMGAAKAWMDAGGDPFGGNARLGLSVRYAPDGKGAVTRVVEGAGAAIPYQGIVAKFGLQPYGPEQILPGGIPSSASGDGSGPRKAIYIGGAWADGSAVNPACKRGWDPDAMTNPVVQCRYYNENPYELPGCATVKIPAGTQKWFKLDTWMKDNAGRALKTQIWLDDELDGATKPSGGAAFGAANMYNIGTQPYDGWNWNFSGDPAPQTNNNVNGYVMALYPPDVLQPNYAFAAPNAWIFTLDVSGTGGLRRSCGSAAYAGQACVPTSKGGQSPNAGVSIGSTGWYNWQLDKDGNLEVPDPLLGGRLVWANVTGAAGKGLAAFNPFQPSHLLWIEGKWDGWVFLPVANQMIWDGTVTVCSYRVVLASPGRN